MEGRKKEREGKSKKERETERERGKEGKKGRRRKKTAQNPAKPMFYFPKYFPHDFRNRKQSKHEFKFNSQCLNIYRLA